MTFVKFASHRSRDRAMRVFQSAGLAKPIAYYSFFRRSGKGIYQVTAEHLQALAAQPYPYGSKWCTTVRGPHDDLHLCWPETQIGAPTCA